MGVQGTERNESRRVRLNAITALRLVTHFVIWREGEGCCTTQPAPLDML